MMADINIDGIINASDSLAHKIITIGGQRKGSSYIFNQCMRAFDHPALPAQSITFSVFLNAPVMKDAEATIDRAGNLTISLV